jgi:hypothetical protein
MYVHGIARLKLGELIDEVRRGGRFVVFSWSIGLGLTTLRRSSAVHFVRAGGRTPSLRHHLRYTLPTAVLGWWAIPWGPASTLASLKQNLAGGQDVTAGVLRTLVRENSTPMTPVPPQPQPLHSHAA